LNNSSRRFVQSISMRFSMFRQALPTYSSSL
jgi:hypothetical protein